MPQLNCGTALFAGFGLVVMFLVPWLTRNSDWRIRVGFRTRRVRPTPLGRLIRGAATELVGLFALAIAGMLAFRSSLSAPVATVVIPIVFIVGFLLGLATLLLAVMGKLYTEIPDERDRPRLW